MTKYPKLRNHINIIGTHNHYALSVRNWRLVIGWALRPMPPTCNWEPRAHYHLPKSYPKWRKIHPRSANSFGNPSKSYPKSIPKASWRPASTNTLYKLDVKHSKIVSEVPKSVHKRSMTMQNLSKMEPKTLPNPVLEQFWSLVVATLNLYRCCMVGFCSFC